MKKGLCIGLVIGLLLGSATTVAANEFVQAQFAKYNLVVNDVEIEMESDPLVYQDSTYLPVRYILNTLGYDVTYLAASRTIVAEKPVERFLADIESLTKDTEGTKGVEEVQGDEDFIVDGIKYKTLEQVDKKIFQLQNLTIKFYRWLAEGGAPTEEARQEAVQLLAGAEADLEKLLGIRDKFLEQLQTEEVAQ